MIYYRLKDEFDFVRIKKESARHSRALRAGELFTPNQIYRINFVEKSLVNSNMFDLVQVNRKDLYFQKGKRFSKSSTIQYAKLFY